jgi:FkbM family methyltransferase
MLTVNFKNLIFKLNNEDQLFKRKMHRFVNEVPEAFDKVEFPSGGIFFEIGLCFGVTSITALKTGRFKEAHGMEPNKLNCELAALNKKLNDVPLIIHPYAASDAPGVGHIADVSKSNIGAHVVTHTPGAGDEVSLITIDELLEKEKINPEEITFVWCDAQGSEGKLVKGASKILAQKVPWVIEVAPDLLMQNNTTVDDLVEGFGPHFKGVADLKEKDLNIRPIEELKDIHDYYLNLRKPVSQGVTKASHTNVLLYPHFCK